MEEVKRVFLCRDCNARFKVRTHSDTGTLRLVWAIGRRMEGGRGPAAIYPSVETVLQALRCPLCASGSVLPFPSYRDIRSVLPEEEARYVFAKLLMLQEPPMPLPE